jgi:hypothetical protein
MVSFMMGCSPDVDAGRCFRQYQFGGYSFPLLMTTATAFANAVKILFFR